LGFGPELDLGAAARVAALRGHDSYESLKIDMDSMARERHVDLPEALL
jgi:hypothetical protein